MIQLDDMIVIRLKCYSTVIEIVLQKTLLNQRERICCLNLN